MSVIVRGANRPLLTYFLSCLNNKGFTGAKYGGSDPAPSLPNNTFTAENIDPNYCYGVSTDPLKSGIETSDSGLYLYFYVGETVQNANLINAGRIEEKVASLIPDNSSIIAGYAMPSNKYINLTLGASGTTYTAPANGYVYIARRAGANNQYIAAGNTTSGLSLEVDLPYTNNRATILLPVKKSDTYGINYTASGSDLVFIFIYAEGEV